jgi:broad specificity phosphatase PhoE
MPRVMYLVRHGATANNVANPPVLQGCHVDAPLSSEGESQADAVARQLSQTRICRVYSSPLLRARQTAEPIARVRRCDVECVPMLREVDVGRWEGRSWVNIAREDSEAYQQFQSRPDLFGYAGGENLSQVAQRVVPALLELLQSAEDGPIAVVAHNVVNRVFLAHLLKVPLSEARTLSQHNGGINVITQQHSDPIVETLNTVFHLQRA